MAATALSDVLTRNPAERTAIIIREHYKRPKPITGKIQRRVFADVYSQKAR